jgi:lipoprotein-anchoring transpeptidase ErfK/SrfK
MSESTLPVIPNGIQLPNGVQLPNGMQFDHGLRPNLDPWRRRMRRRLTLRLSKRTRRVIRVVLVILLTLIVFLLMVEPVAASVAAAHKNARGRISVALGRDARPDTSGRLAEPLPEPVVLPVTGSGADESVTHYARVIQEDAPVYSHPGDVAQGLLPKRTLGVGYIWVSVQGKTTYDGQDFYQINTDEYVEADALSFQQPSAFLGVALAEHPQEPFAWILTSVQPSRAPAGETNAEASVYQRYQLVQILATEHIGEQVWYQIGADQWIDQITVGKVTPSAAPEGVTPGEKWIDVDLFEQTLAAYEGDRMVYATLVSSGLRGWDTPVGLNRVWLKVAAGKMSGAEGRPDYYFLEDVPWTMYFNGDVALHAAYWHDGFGYRHSHGCVNLAPSDAQWLFQWAPEDVWVWVH